MKVFITGGTGFIGRHVSAALRAGGHEVTVLTRPGSAGKLPHGVRRLEADPLQPGPWQREVPRHDAVINLAGKSISGRWSGKVQQEILESRLMITHNLTAAFSGRETDGIRFLSASAVGFYGLEGEGDVDESASPGPDFLAMVCAQWEEQAREAERFGARVALCRFGIVLGSDGGMLPRLVPMFRRRMGLRLGNGRQGVSWIHIDDLTRGLLFLLEKPDISGPVNLTAPHPVDNREMTASLNRALGRRSPPMGLPGFLLRMILGEFANTLLGGRRVTPRRLVESGFEFRFPGLDQALAHLLSPSPGDLST